MSDVLGDSEDFVRKKKKSWKMMKISYSLLRWGRGLGVGLGWMSFLVWDYEEGYKLFSYLVVCCVFFIVLFRIYEI